MKKQKKHNILTLVVGSYRRLINVWILCVVREQKKHNILLVLVVGSNRRLINVWILLVVRK